MNHEEIIKNKPFWYKGRLFKSYGHYQAFLISNWLEVLE